MRGTTVAELIVMNSPAPQRRIVMTMSRCHMLKLGILIVVTMLFPFGALAEEDGESQDIRRHCIGLLWCTEQSANSTSTDGLLLLYSAEERGSYSRLAVRPLYSMEEDPTRDLLRRRILWPLGTYERRGDHTWAHVFPLYWHSERPGQEWTLHRPALSEVDPRRQCMAPSLSLIQSPCHG